MVAARFARWLALIAVGPSALGGGGRDGRPRAPSHTHARSVAPGPSVGRAENRRAAPEQRLLQIALAHAAAAVEPGADVEAQPFFQFEIFKTAGTISVRNIKQQVNFTINSRDNFIKKGHFQFEISKPQGQFQ